MQHAATCELETSEIWEANRKHSSFPLWLSLRQMTVGRLNPPHQARRWFEMANQTLFKVVHGHSRFWCSVSEAKVQESGALCGGVGLLLRT